MLSEAERRLLLLLTTFPAQLEKAWDVPRDISLPGLAERLGVVRSALNPPITKLEKSELVTTRKTHVIGGGHRKRTVVHITEKGREICTELEPVAPKKKSGTISKYAPPLTHMFGRDELLGKICEAANRGETIQLLGLPGIGKSALLRHLAEEKMDAGWDVAWSSIEQFHDVSKLTSDLLSLTDSPNDIDASTAAICELSTRKKGKLLLVVDELQAVHERHRDSILSLLVSLIKTKELSLAIGCRAPSPLDNGTIFIIEEIDDDSAIQILPDNLNSEDASEVVSALGGHPLALKLWQPGHSLPEADDRIQEFIRKDVVDKLSDEVISTMDELASSPRPLLAGQLSNQQGVDELDETALLRWASETIELQHLVRNVRRAMWNEEEAKQIHLAAFEHWKERIEPEARLHESYHRVHTSELKDAETLAENLNESLPSMMSIDSAAAAAIIADAVTSLPDIHKLRLLSAKVAIERGEGEIAESELKSVENSIGKNSEWLLLDARIKRLRGNFDEANRQEADVLETLDPKRAIKIQLNRIVSGLEDRLPGRIEKSVITATLNALNNISLDSLNSDTRRAALVTIATIKHSLALATNNADEAAKIRTDLATTASRNDPIIEELAARAALKIGGDPSRIKSLISRALNPTRRCALGLLLVENANQSGGEKLQETLNNIDPPSDLGTTTARRLSAIHWYWRGVADQTNRLKYWQESLYRFGMAECANAYIQLQHKLHEAIRL